MKPQMPPLFCASATTCSASVVLPDDFGPVNLDDAAARQPADAERDVEPERAGGDRLDLDRLLVLAEPHDRALAAIALDLRDRRFKRLLFIHFSSFDEAQRDIHHGGSPLFHKHARVANGWLRRTLPGSAMQPWSAWVAEDASREVRELYTFCSPFAMFFLCSSQHGGNQRGPPGSLGSPSQAGRPVMNCALARAAKSPSCRTSSSKLPLSTICPCSKTRMRSHCAPWPADGR